MEKTISKENEKKLKEIFVKFENNTRQLTQEFLNELKEDVKTYGELEEKLNIFEKSILWEGLRFNYEEYAVFLRHVRQLIEKEKNDLQIANRSK